MRPASFIKLIGTAMLMRALAGSGVLIFITSFLQAPSTPYQERDFLTRIRRLTVEGRRAGEGYWSPDGKRIVFQSEREPGNPIRFPSGDRSEEHTSELQSRFDLVCRLLLEHQNQTKKPMGAYHNPCAYNDTR